jgi:hypothetical protein
MLDRLCGLLQKEDCTLASWIAKQLALIVDPKDDTLSPKNFAVIKVSPSSSLLLLHWALADFFGCLFSSYLYSALLIT